MTVDAIVLAGGRSSRFGADKLSADLDGRTVLEATIAAVANAADCVIVAGRRPPGDSPVAHAAVVWLADEAPFAGPLVGLAGALPAATSELVIVAGGDMPGLVAAVLELMLARLVANRDVDAVILDRPPCRQVLPLAVRVSAASQAAAETIEAGDRSLARFLARLRVDAIPASEWTALDPREASLLDIDRPEDLERISG